MAEIPLDLFSRIADRANDPMRRTYMAGANANATPMDFGALTNSFTVPRHSRRMVTA